MISRTCPKLSYGFNGDWGECLEAFALSYLATYANVALPARVVDSYKRAWGIDVLHTFPRVPNARPTSIVAYYESAGLKKVHVAIEPTTSLEQLQYWRGSNASSAMLPIPGHCWAIAKNYASDTFVALNADPDWVAHRDDPRTVYTFSGYSLGAAIAEIMAARWKEARPDRHTQLFKFGSPRVGTAIWQNWKGRHVPYSNIYCERDPVSLLPQDYLTTANIVLGPWTLLAGPTTYCQDPKATVFDRNGRALGMYQAGRIRSAGGTYADYVATHDVTNPWFFHNKDLYRAMLSAIASQNPELKYRFLYLEHPDENSWGIDYPTFTWQTPTRKRIIVPTPSDITPEQLGVGDLFAAPPSVQEQVPQPDTAASEEVFAGGDWGVDLTNDGGGDWETGEPRPVEAPRPAFAGTTVVIPRRLGRRVR